MTNRLAIMAYAGLAYLVAMISLAYIVGFLADFGVPKGINDGTNSPVWLALIIDAGLVAVFGLQHSTTARRRFKAWWTGYVPPSIERATYLYMTAGMTIILVTLWRPIPVTIWRIDQPVLAGIIVTFYLAVWLLMYASTFLFGHLNFFGVQQALDRFRQRPAGTTTFTARYLYALVRHPISLGWMLTPWLTPHMTVGQLTFAVSIMVYVLIATRFEEADLIEELGERYLEYRKQVPAYIPGLSTREKSADDSLQEAQ
jgi:protein-S-isoprenylcysteine O-methyltransferase Ste14